MNKYQVRYSKSMARNIFIHVNSVVTEIVEIQENTELDKLPLASMLSILEGIIQDCTDIKLISKQALTKLPKQKRSKKQDG